MKLLAFGTSLRRLAGSTILINPYDSSDIYKLSNHSLASQSIKAVSSPIQRYVPLVNPTPEGLTHVKIWNSEEKGSDVNLATYLIHDAWQGLFDEALVLSQDTDLIEPVRIVRDEIKKPMGIVVLDGKAPSKLTSFRSFVRHITPSRLAAAQFPESVPFGRKGKRTQRPVEWS